MDLVHPEGSRSIAMAPFPRLRRACYLLLMAEYCRCARLWPSSPASDQTFEIFNPSTGELLAKLADMGIEETRAAIGKAHVAQSRWAALTARERSDILWRWRQLMSTTPTTSQRSQC